MIIQSCSNSNMVKCRRFLGGLLHVLSTWSCVFVLPTFAPPVTDFDNSRFPEQDLGPPEQLQDGQSAGDKAYIIRMINHLERQAVAAKQRPQVIPFLREYVFEGDIILQRNQALQLVSYNRGRKKRKIDTQVLVAGSNVKWSLPINYILDTNYTEHMKESIRAGLRHIEEETCVTFTNNENSPNKSLSIINGTGCYSFVGNDASKTVTQIVSLGERCFKKGTIAHEIMHALGFWHEHSRKDRDEYLTVIDKHIELGKKHNFDTMSWRDINNLGQPFDVGSSLLYSGESFALPGTNTIVSKDPLLQMTMGQREEMSFYDARHVNMVYCNDTCDPAELSGSCLYDGYQDPKNCSRCRCPEGLSGDNCETVAPSDTSCGGTIILGMDSNVTLMSPGYPVSYAAGLKCYWLIKSPEGTAVHMQFIKPYMNSGYCDSENIYQPCRDFAEIRFTDHLGITGGRFCCDDHLQRANLQTPIVTNANHALVLFRSFQDTTAHSDIKDNIGFKLQVTIDSCGGCQNNVTDSQVPCYRQVVKMCLQSYTTTVRYNSCSWWTSECYSAYSTKIANRQSQCYSEEAHCCHGYKLAADGLRCNKNTMAVATTASTTASVTEPAKTTSANESAVEADSGDMVAWSGWSTWGPCSISCGSGDCGSQSRSRTCLEPQLCNGDATQTETQLCGTNTTCDLKTFNMICGVVKTVEYSCASFIGPGTCYRKETSYDTVVKSCCCNTITSDNVCIE